MSKFIRFTDAVTGYASIKQGLSKDLKTINDSSSPSGKALTAQIEMTHAGIVTRNMGFYLPENMKKGADTFTKDYNKPVLVGHDADTDPIGRVIKADYIDTSFQYIQNDKYLSSLIKFQDKKHVKKNDMVSFVQHVIGEYSNKDSYRGLGHINGTLRITDPEAIQKILDERYLTVSISMSSDSAFCSECGQDWVNEGQCEHERGQVYDSGVPVVLIPGKQSYNHVGFVSEPADKFAAGLKGVELVENDSVKQLDSVIQVSATTFSDKFSIAASLFGSQDGAGVFSLSDETQTNLLEVKDSIAKLEDSLKPMEKDKMSNFADYVSAGISLYLSNGEGESTSIEVRKYAETLTPEELEKLAGKAAAALASQEETLTTQDSVNAALHDFFMSEISASTQVEDSAETEAKIMKSVKTLNNKFRLVDGAEYDVTVEDGILAEIQKIEGVNLTDKEAKELASLVARSQNGDAIASLTLETKDKTVEECVNTYVSLKDSMFKLTAVTAEDIVTKMNDHLPEGEKIVFESIVAKDCAGSGKYFPILNKACVGAAKKVLALTIASDSVRGKVLENIEKISSKLVDSITTEVTTQDKAEENSENFDSATSTGDNQMELNDDTLVAELTKLVQLATERDLMDSFIAPFLAEKELEVGVLEQQLILAYDEIDELLSSLQEFKDSTKQELAEKVVDAKINSGLFELKDRESEISKHSERTEDSLKDALNDLSETKAVKIADQEKVESPVLTNDSGDLQAEVIDNAKEKQEAAKELNRKNIMKTYNILNTTRGKAFADSWLNKQNF